MYVRQIGRCCAAMWLSVAFGLVAVASAPGRADDTLPAHRIVLRLSDTMLNSLMTKGIDRETDVRDTILGTAIYGRARILAKPGVALKDCPDQATFQVLIEGTAHSRSTGYNGPAIIYSRSVTHFTATKQVVFDPGRGFYALPPEVHARTTTYTDGIDSTRGGIVGRIVRRRATEQAAAKHDEAQEIARQKAERRIAAAFDRLMDERLARLNKAAEFRTMAINALRPAGSPEPKYSCCSTVQYLQIATNFGEGGPAIELPLKGPASLAAAPIEVWIHNSLVGDQFAAALQLLKTHARVSDFLVALSATAKIIEGPSSSRSPVQALTGELPINMRKVGAWLVVEIDPTSGDDVAATAQARSRIAAAPLVENAH